MTAGGLTSGDRDRQVAVATVACDTTAPQHTQYSTVGLHTCRAYYHSRPLGCSHYGSDLLPSTTRKSNRRTRRRRPVATTLSAGDGGRAGQPRVTANYYNKPSRDFREHAPGLRIADAASKTIFLRSALGGRIASPLPLFPPPLPCPSAQHAAGWSDTRRVGWAVAYGAMLRPLC